MIKAVLFDFGQTLVDSADGFRAAEKAVKNSIYADLCHGDESVCGDDFLAEYRLLRKAFHEQSRFSRVALWQAVYERYGKRPDLGRLEEWESEYWAQVKERTVAFSETLSVLEKLARRFKLGLVTNTQGQSTSGGHRIGLFPQIECFFESIIVAGEAGVPPKPDPLPFHLCLERLGVSAHEAVYVGDDWRIDICGAREAGLRPVWLKHSAVKRNWPDVEATVPVVTSLDSLLEMDFGALKP